MLVMSDPILDLSGTRIRPAGHLGAAGSAVLHQLEQIASHSWSLGNEASRRSFGAAIG